MTVLGYEAWLRQKKTQELGPPALLRRRAESGPAQVPAR